MHSCSASKVSANPSRPFTCWIYGCLASGSLDRSFPLRMIKVYIQEYVYNRNVLLLEPAHDRPYFLLGVSTRGRMSRSPPAVWFAVAAVDVHLITIVSNSTYIKWLIFLCITMSRMAMNPIPRYGATGRTLCITNL